MARNHRTALYLNDPIKWIAGVLSIRQVVSLGAVGLLAYGLVKITGHLPYDKSTAGQLHLMLVICVPGLLAFLAWSLLDKGAVEPYPKQLAGYLLRTAADLPLRLTLAARATVARAMDTARRTRARHDAARAARITRPPRTPRTVTRLCLPTSLRALIRARHDAIGWLAFALPAHLQGRRRLPTRPNRRRDKAAGARSRTIGRARRPARPPRRYTMAYGDRAARRRQRRRRRAPAVREAS